VPTRGASHARPGSTKSSASFSQDQGRPSQRWRPEMQRRFTWISSLLTRATTQDVPVCPDCRHPGDRESEASAYWLASLVGVQPVTGRCQHQRGTEMPCPCLSYSHTAGYRSSVQRRVAWRADVAAGRKALLGIEPPPAGAMRRERTPRGTQPSAKHVGLVGDHAARPHAGGPQPGAIPTTVRDRNRKGRSARPVMSGG
jgi:hypothetical protein